MMSQKRLQHGMLLDAKAVMDNVLPLFIEHIKEFVPECLHRQLDDLFDEFESELVDCDVAE